MISNLLSVDNLTCIRGDRVLFKRIGFNLDRGGLLYVMGENGSGKSSLLRLLCGLMQPEIGSVAWQGRKMTARDEAFQSELFYLGHLNGLKDDLSATENLQTNARLAGDKSDMQHVLAALDAIGIAQCANLPVRILSQGQKRRVALARLWLTNRCLWVLDEPFATLDDASVGRLVALINQHLATGGMVIVTTHQDVAINTQSIQVLRLDA